jgi:dihydrofolate reductase
MAKTDSRVTIHMAASLDSFIARKDGRVDWMETADEFAGGATMDPGFVEAFLKSIDCYVMGSKTYETALRFEAKGLGWAYGDKPLFVLTSRKLPRTRNTVEFYSGDLASRRSSLFYLANLDRGWDPLFREARQGCLPSSFGGHGL